MPAERVALAISAFRSDAAVIELLRGVCSRAEQPFHYIVVVDSLGSGAIQAAIDTHGWPVRYINSQVNLGSAGNLGTRIDAAAESQADWCYCVNHDGTVDPENVRQMLESARRAGRVGAVYPLLNHGNRNPPWEAGRQTFFPSASKRMEARPQADVEVLWSSSNGALYSLAPHRQGLHVWKELWMGYEDLGYGMLLHMNGWKQLACARSEMHDIFDYRAARLGSKEFLIPDKPVWYPYYNIRNLIIIQRRLPFSIGMALKTVVKIFKESLKIALLENHRMKRLSLLWAGALHGLQGRSGKGQYP